MGAGVNAYATCDHYESVQRATKLIKPGAFLAKIDLKSAYRHVPIHPSNYNATGLQWTFTGCTTPTYLFDTKLPFGARRSPGIFHRLTQSVTRMMARRGFTVLTYLDDFLLIADTAQECWAESEINEALQAAINKTKLTKRELQCLAGRLKFCSASYLWREDFSSQID